MEKPGFCGSEKSPRIAHMQCNIERLPHHFEVPVDDDYPNSKRALATISSATSPILRPRSIANLRSAW